MDRVGAVVIGGAALCIGMLRSSGKRIDDLEITVDQLGRTATKNETRLDEIDGRCAGHQRWQNSLADEIKGLRVDLNAVALGAPATK